MWCLPEEGNCELLQTSESENVTYMYNLLTCQIYIESSWNINNIKCNICKWNIQAIYLNI